MQWSTTNKHEKGKEKKRGKKRNERMTQPNGILITLDFDKKLILPIAVVKYNFY